MADQKISELTAAASATAAHEFAVNEAGSSKKVTGAQIQALTANPSSDDGDALGSASFRWSDVFLAEGAVINWDNGDATITQTGNEIAIAGANLKLAAGETGFAPLLIPAGTLMTTPSDGAIEADGNCFYGTTDGGNRGVIPVEHFIRCNATRTLPNDTALNAIFDGVTNGRLTLEVGTYLFDMMAIVTSMSGSSGNALVNILGAGSATVGAWLWRFSGIDNTTPGSSVDDDSQYLTGAASNVLTAGTGTAMRFEAKGTFEVTVAGTIVPSIDQVTGAAAIVAIGSYFRCRRIGSDSVVSVGQWD